MSWMATLIDHSLAEFSVEQVMKEKHWVTIMTRMTMEIAH